MSADPRFCSLTYLDLDSGAAFKIVYINPKPAGSHLHNYMTLVREERLMETSFTCTHKRSYFCYCFCKSSLGVQADRTITHMANHDRRLYLEIRGKFGKEIHVTIRVLFYGQ